ncbi:30S ribosomal protein S4 [Candidatus Roizmanbacteria bacterium]|nr:30S ribosomal protein S4 [Candidatus Roizmanbacteria bacterium]
MRYLGPKNRISRREGVDLGLKTPGSKSHAQLLRRLNILPGQHGAKRRRKVTERATQLREKQKLRFSFGLTEKQLKKYFHIATLKKGNTAFYVSQFLEKRLDNVVYRLGMSPTRASARQLVRHGHIAINDKKLTIPSHQVKVEDIISFVKDSTQKIPYIEKSLTNKDIIIPSWLERKATVGKLVAEPTSDEIANQVNLRLVIEYYSR